MVQHSARIRRYDYQRKMPADPPARLGHPPLHGAGQALANRAAMDGAQAIGNIVAVLEELRIDRASVNRLAIADGAQRLLFQAGRPLELRRARARAPHAA